MTHETHYEVKVTRATEIQAAYEYVKANNIKFYRAVAANGKIYGWQDNKYVPAQQGQEWFENPDYIDPASEENIIADEISEEIPVADEIVAEEIPSVVDEIPEVDYKALYEDVNEKYLKLQEEHLSTSFELHSIKSAVKVIVELFKRDGE